MVIFYILYTILFFFWQIFLLDEHLHIYLFLPIILFFYQILLSNFHKKNCINFINKHSNYLIILSNKCKILQINHDLMEKICNNYQVKSYKKIKNLISYLNYDIVKKITAIITNNYFNEKFSESFYDHRKDILYCVIKETKYILVKIQKEIINNNIYTSFFYNEDEKSLQELKYKKIKNLPIIDDKQFIDGITLNDDLNYLILDNKNSVDEKIKFFTIINNFHSHIYNQIWNIYFKNNTIPTFFTSLNGSIIFQNNEMKNLTNSNISDPTNDHNIFLADLINENSQDIFQDTWNNLVTKKKSIIKIKVSLNNIANSLMIMHLQIIKDEFILVSMIDITEQRNLELQFIHSQKMQAIGQLAGGIAHDFNNLLTAMIGFCDILLTKHFPGDESFTYITHIKHNVNRAANLVKQLLALSRQQVLQTKIFNPYNVIHELSFLIRRLIGEGITLNLAGNANVHNIKFDQGQLEQIIINLAINARDAMNHQGNLTIAIKNVQITSENHPTLSMFSPIYDEQMHEGDYIEIDIIDDGSGIDEKNLNKIFEPFFSTKGNTGNGLGLSTVYGIIKQANDFIFVQTKENHGTKFSIFINICKQSTKDNKALDEKNKKLYDETGNSSILIIEDDDSVRMLMTNVLQNRGYKIQSVNCGADALKIFENYNSDIDIIISDIIMPDTDGPKIVQKIHEKYSKIKVIFISGYSKQYLTEKNIENDDIYFLQKPFTMQDIIKLIKDIENI